MDQDLIKKEYDDLVVLRALLATNLEKALEEFLKDGNISYHTVSSRIKEKKSYIEKIERKGYTDHQNQMEDLCGLRIICYYPEDLEKIGEIITKEFNLIEAINKSNLLEPDKFGYRSDHYIVTIKDEWIKAPNYRKLKNIKAEIQVRTILMHAWADIEHKLAYKSKEQIPPQFRRQLYQLSALLEIADAQFQNLKIERDQLKESMIIENSFKEKVFNADQELNLDSLQALLDFYFPNRKQNSAQTSDLLEKLKILQISIKQIDDSIKKFLLIGIDLEKELGTDSNYFVQVGIMRFILDLYNDQHWQSRQKQNIKPEGWVSKVNEIRARIHK